MTTENKYRILDLHGRGLTYSQIAAELGISINTVKSCYRRAGEKKKLCKNCGKPLIQIEKQKPKTFCNSYCRENWWKNNRNKSNSKSIYQLECRYCGQFFLSYGNKHRKYCSHKCYIHNRFYSKIKG